MMNRMLAKVMGGRSRKPILMTAQVEPQIPQSRIQTMMVRALVEVAMLARLLVGIFTAKLLGQKAVSRKGAKNRKTQGAKI